MSKPVLGLALGGCWDSDGLTAWFSPRSGRFGDSLPDGQRAIAGILIGYFAKKFNSLPLGIAVGLVLALVAAPSETGDHYYSRSCCREHPRIDRGFAPEVRRPSAQQRTPAASRRF
jgi:hypothetical protein